MNKTTPFLQEIEEVPVASDAPTQEPEVIEGTSEGAIKSDFVKPHDRAIFRFWGYS